MKILIVSGFLGAGKTTFIKELAKKTGKEIAILENEYGASGIDGDRLKEATGQVNIWELTEGCICCSVKADFATSVLTIANTVNPDYLVIEPTGVAILSNLIQNIKKVEYERIRLMAPIAIVDAHSIERYKKEFPDIFLNQIEYADTVVLSKGETLSPLEQERIKDEIHRMNPNCRFNPNHYSTLSDEWWNALVNKYLDGSLVIKEVEDPENMPDTFSLEGISIRHIHHFIVFLENLIRGYYGNIIRAKGSFLFNNINIHFDVADGLYSIYIGGDAVSDKAVFIGFDMKKQKIREVMLATSKYIKIGLRGNKKEII